MDGVTHCHPVVDGVERPVGRLQRGQFGIGVGKGHYHLGAVCSQGLGQLGTARVIECNQRSAGEDGVRGVADATHVRLGLRGHEQLIRTLGEVHQAVARTGDARRVRLDGGLRASSCAGGVHDRNGVLAGMKEPPAVRESGGGGRRYLLGELYP